MNILSTVSFYEIVEPKGFRIVIVLNIIDKDLANHRYNFVIFGFVHPSWSLKSCRDAPLDPLESYDALAHVFL